MNLIHIAYAQGTGNQDTASGIITWFIDLINNSLVPLVFAIAFLLFLFGVFKYFFGSGATAEENRQKGRQFILWAIIAFAVMITVWGLVNILVNTIPGLQDQTRPCLPTFDGECDSASGSRRGGQPTNLLPIVPENEPQTQDGLTGTY